MSPAPRKDPKPTKAIGEGAETVKRSMAFAYRDRRCKKRTFRSLWILRISAACKEKGISYSRFIAGLKASKIDLDRKIISDIAIHDKKGFEQLTEVSKAKVA